MAVETCLILPPFRIVTKRVLLHSDNWWLSGPMPGRPFFALHYSETAAR